MLADLVTIANSALVEQQVGELSLKYQTHTGEYSLDVYCGTTLIGGVDEDTLVLYMPIFDEFSGFMASDYLKLRNGLRWKSLKFIIGKEMSFETPMDEMRYFLDFYSKCPYAHVFVTKHMELSPSVFKTYLLLCDNKVMAEVHDTILPHPSLCRRAGIDIGYVVSVLSQVRPMEV